MKINFELKRKSGEIRSKAKSPLRASGSLGKIVLFPQISSIRRKQMYSSLLSQIKSKHDILYQWNRNFQKLIRTVCLDRRPKESFLSLLELP